MTNAAEEFLKKKTGHCKLLRMWLTPDGCAAIRNRGSRKGIGAPIQCADCPGVVMGEDVYQAPTAVSMSQETALLTKLGSDTMEKQTYTVSELAALLGVKAGDVANAKAFRYVKKSVPGSKNHTVREGMRKRGITWDQVMDGRGTRQKPPTAPAGTSPRLLSPTLSPTPPIEPEAVPSVIEAPPLPAPVPPPHIAEDKPVEEGPSGLEALEHAVLGLISLEKLIGELKRRLPGSAITVSW